MTWPSGSPTGGAGQRPRTHAGSSRVGLLVPVVILAIVVAGLLGACRGAAGSGLAVEPAQGGADIAFVIPEGAGEALDAGRPLNVLPTRLEVRVGQVIEIENDDDRGHLVGPFFVRSGETLRQRFSSPGGVHRRVQRAPIRPDHDHRGLMARRATAVVATMATIALVILAGSAPAAADPPGPTDYRSVVTSVDPPLPGVEVEVEVVGGDSFIELHQAGEEPVVVLGYAGESYLRFDPDGTVWENEVSPAHFLNRDRYGRAEVGDEANADAEPKWRQVADSGRYAWHDHRTHWMNPGRPPGRSPGDLILEAVVPLRVGDRKVEVAVASYWVPAPSPVPALIGGAVGLLCGAAMIVRRRNLAVLAAAALAGATSGLALGVWATVSVPSETGPSLLLWALPAVALVAALVATVAHRLETLVRFGLVGLAAAELFWWSWSRRAAVVRALVPTDAPLPIDRAAIVGVGVLAAGLLIAIAVQAIESWSGREPVAR